MFAYAAICCREIAIKSIVVHTRNLGIYDTFAAAFISFYKIATVDGPLESQYTP